MSEPHAEVDPVFVSRADLAAWARQRWRFPDPAPGARARALEDIRRVTLAHMHLPASGEDAQ